MDLKAQHAMLRSEIDTAIAAVIDDAAFIGGPRVQELEDAIASYCGVSHAVACGNGTDALFLILAALGHGKGDEVITTPFTFFATAEAIVHVGARPVFVDIEPGTYNLDASQLETAVTERTRAIMPVHIFGQCANMDAIDDVAHRFGLEVIEDACQAIGATHQGRRAGSLGRAAAFSFFPSKNLGCAGDGGMLVTDDEDLAAKARTIASHGTTRKYFHKAFGVNSRLDALQAAILLVKLPHLDAWNEDRRRAARVYDELLAGADGLELPVQRSYGEHVYHLYVVKARSPELARQVMDAMSAEGIGTALYYPLALHEQEALAGLEGYSTPFLPVAESCGGAVFALPCYPGITEQQQRTVVSVVREVLESQ